MDEFLTLLFGYKPEEAYVLLWLLDGKKSAWFRDLSEAARYADKHDRQDVYVGVGLSPQDFGPSRRCRVAEIMGLPGLWADLDVAGAAHKKNNLPPTEADARALVAEMVLEPTVIIWSGHGLQVWWLFKEPWIFDGPAEREHAMQLAAAWNRTLRHKALAHGWDVDATADLARVMRVPGTLNLKVEGAPEIVVSTDVHPERRYDPSDFEEYLLSAPAPEHSASAPLAPVSLPDVDPNAQPPFTKFEALCEAEPRFLRSWQRKRNDLQDQSPSGYDQSQANFCVQAGWTDQEITDLLIASRRKHGDDLKRADYYQRTCATARGGLERERALEAIEELTSTDGDADVPEGERREKILAELTRLLGIGIRRVVKYTSDPPEYRLETENGAIGLGEVAGLINQEPLRRSLAAVSGYYLPRIKSKEWEKVAQWLLNVCEDEQIGEEATGAGRARAWIDMYLSGRAIFGEEELDKAARLREPYRNGDDIMVFGASLRKWISTDQLEGVTAKQMGMLLKATGCVPERLNLLIGGRHTTASVWRLPPQQQAAVEQNTGLRVIA